MKIEHKIVEQYASETRNTMHHANQILEEFGGNVAMAKASERGKRWSRPLAGVVYIPGYDDDEDWTYRELDDAQTFEKFFWDYKYFAKQEVHINKDGKLCGLTDYWGEDVRITREREEQRARYKAEMEAKVKAWKPPTVADIINSSVDQFVEGKALTDQYFVYEFSQSWISANCQQMNTNYHQFAVREGYHIKENEYFIKLRFPMREYLEWNKIEFDGSKYTFNGKSVLLKDLMGEN